MQKGHQQSAIKIKKGGTPGSSGSQDKGSPVLQYVFLGLTGVFLVLLGGWAAKNSVNNDSKIGGHEAKLAGAVPTATPEISLVLGETKATDAEVIVSKDLGDPELRGIVIDSSRTFNARKSALVILAERKAPDLPAIIYAGILNNEPWYRVFLLKTIVDLFNEQSQGHDLEKNGGRSNSALIPRNIAAAVIPSLSDPDASVREQAAISLGQLRDVVVLKSLGDRLEIETNLRVRNRISEAIERVNGFYLVTENGSGDSTSE
jgi:HEAT repeat protein